MRRSPRLVPWLTGLAVLLVIAWVATRWVMTTLYPLDPYRQIIFQWSQEYGLDPYLVAAVIRQESKFQPNATSYQGARGLMQILPETGRWAAEQMGVAFRPEMLYEADYNIRMGCWYLAHQLKQFRGGIVPALAAYNGGQRNVREWLSEERWTGEEHTIDQIPFPETRHYVRRVMQSYERYQQVYSSYINR